MCALGAKGPRTLSNTTDSHLDCDVFDKSSLLFVVLKGPLEQNDAYKREHIQYDCGILMNKSIHPVLNLPTTFRGAWKSSCAVERGPSLVTPSNGGVSKPPISSAGLAGAVGGGKKMSISSEDSLSDFEELGGRS